MRTERFKAVIECVARLTEAQLDQLVEAVEQRRVRTKALRILETARDASKCLHCGSPAVVKNGHSLRAATLPVSHLQADLQRHDRHALGRAALQRTLFPAG